MPRRVGLISSSKNTLNQLQALLWSGHTHTYIHPIILRYRIDIKFDMLISYMTVQWVGICLLYVCSIIFDFLSLQLSSGPIVAKLFYFDKCIYWFTCYLSVLQFRNYIINFSIYVTLNLCLRKLRKFSVYLLMTNLKIMKCLKFSSKYHFNLIFHICFSVNSI